MPRKMVSKGKFELFHCPNCGYVKYVSEGEEPPRECPSCSDDVSYWSYERGNEVVVVKRSKL